MTEAAKKARAEYLKKWKQEHPDRVRQYNETYWERKAAKPEAEKEQANETE